MKYTLCLVAALTIPILAGDSHRRVQLKGQWNPDHPEHFEAVDGLLEIGTNYLLTNNTTNTMYVFLTQMDTPVNYFPVLAGETVGFTAWCDSLDLFLRGSEGIRLNGKGGVVLREGLEAVED